MMSPRKPSCRRGAIEGGTLSKRPPLVGADNGARTSDIRSQGESGEIQARVTEEDYENQQNQKKVKKEHRFGVLYILHPSYAESARAREGKEITRAGALV